MIKQTAMQKHKIILDTDIGIDDAFALAYALSHHQLDLVAITTVFGNLATTAATTNAEHFLGLTGSDLCVYEGAKQPFDGSPQPTGGEVVHGKSGLGNYQVEVDDDLPHNHTNPRKTPAYKALAELVLAHPHQITLVPVGPLTNIALLAENFPQAVPAVKEIVLMGGAFFKQGNVTPCAEANIFHDPKAAEIVYKQNWPVTSVGLDVTEQLICTMDDFKPFLKPGHKLSTLLSSSLKFYCDFYKKFSHIEGCMMHDPAALLTITHPHLFKFMCGSIQVSTESFTKGGTYFKCINRSSPKLSWPEHTRHRIAVEISANDAKNALVKAVADLLTATSLK